MAKVLILDHSKSVRNILRERLEYEGFSAEAVEDEATASDMCEKVPFDLIISDTGCKVPDAGIPFIALSADASVDSAVEAVRNGAQDFLTKPIDMNRLMQSIHRTIENPAPAPAAPAPVVRRSRRARPAEAEHIIGISPEIEHVRQLIDKVAPCEARVLITGENGTGKELVARWLHAKSSRAAAPFVEVNCAAIPSELIESELFGHERGAFTSAIKQRKGKFEQADGGTLFMDEIGDMSLAAQAKVLRALQESRISRVGGDKEIEVDVRVIAATSRNLEKLMEQGLFREDLYYRLNVFPIHLPDLAERRSDIPLLAAHFLAKFNKLHRRRIRRISSSAMNLMTAYHWPGNVRELENCIERAVLTATDDSIHSYGLPAALQAAARHPGSNSLGDFASRVEAFERTLIVEALKANRGNVAASARMLNLTIRILHYKIGKLGITPALYR